MFGRFWYRPLPIAALLLLAATAAEGQLRTPAPRVVASGGVRYSVAVDDSVVSSHATQHVAQAEAVSRQIVCQLVQLPCSVQYEVHQVWRVEPDWAEAGPDDPIPPETVDGDGGFLAAPLAAAPDSLSVIASNGSLGDGTLTLAVGEDVYVYAVAWWGTTPYMCASRKGVLGVRRVTYQNGSGGRMVMGWEGPLVKRPGTCATVAYSSDDPSVAAIVNTIWADPFGDGSMRTKVGVLRGVSAGDDAPAPAPAPLRQG